ncbi:hypothetical protein [uncultured Clostridium sp.]|jgi:predicted ribosome quality control (RQC) complex YloA/Tae2 family protein|uniref:hypothetical protein n=1 Tax=uncultured Clostridium sp. TaxID=59620 RepID=UPI0026039CF0|nr:hypothetical protein [uncultured Clostridium sp.]MCI9110292.1 hypothetical protein [Bacilli bacterium]
MHKKALEIYKKELEKLKNKYEKKLQAEIEKNDKKLEKFKEEYPDLKAVDEAYACGVITSAKRDKLYEKFANIESLNNYQSSTGQLIRILERDIKSIQIELNL